MTTEARKCNDTTKISPSYDSRLFVLLELMVIVTGSKKRGYAQEFLVQAQCDRS
jgi:hypothetical protein